MPPRISRSLSLGLLGAMLSCQAPDISDEVDEHGYLINEVRARGCECPLVLGYDSPVECDEAVGYLSTADFECLADVLDGNEEAGKDFLDCANAALRGYSQCLELNVDCEVGVYETCTANQMEALSLCPQLPADVQGSFAACTM